MINTLFFQPYPFTEKTFTHALVQSILEGCFVALFLILFEPFGIASHSFENKNLVLAAYGLATCISSLVLRFIIFKSFPVFFSEPNWTIAREVFSILLLMCLILISNVAVTVILYNVKLSSKLILEMGLTILLIGFFPIVFGVMLNYIIQLKKHNLAFQVSPLETTLDSYLDSPLKLFAENKKDFLEIPIEDLLFITSADNYSVVHYQKKDIVQKGLLRTSLSRLEAQLQDDKIVRTHRSYIVNLVWVKEVSGNAQGYQLHLKKYDLKIPVARKYGSVVTNLENRV
ncbi:MAG: LytR/AlgR family response regulator transcription factor [Leadbetterella sp.]